MRTVLVCVRTPLAAQSIASCAARLGVTAIRTVTSEAEAMVRLAERPAELILADTAISRPDTAGFTQRILARVPGATLVFFGPEEPASASAAVAAGARGLIRGDHDPVATVAKALLLIGSSRTAARGTPAGGSDRFQDAAGRSRGYAPRRAVADAGDGPPAAAGGGSDGSARSDARDEAGPDGGEAPPVVPAQRGDMPGAADDPPGTAPTGFPSAPVEHRRSAPDLGLPEPSRVEPEPAGQARPGSARAGTNGTEPDQAESGRAHRPDSETPDSGRPDAVRPPRPMRGRRPALTERELQVLAGMADGKSNAEIGRDLYVSEDTVKTHARRLFRKLGARDRAHAVAVGFRVGALG